MQVAKYEFSQAITISERVCYFLEMIGGFIDILGVLYNNCAEIFIHLIL